MRSMTGDYYTQHWHQQPGPVDPVVLTKEVENLRKLLLLAGAMDDARGTPNCVVEEKVKLIKAVARSVGVSMEDAFPPT